MVGAREGSLNDFDNFENGNFYESFWIELNLLKSEFVDCKLSPGFKRHRASFINIELRTRKYRNCTKWEFTIDANKETCYVRKKLVFELWILRHFDFPKEIGKIR